MGTTLTEDVRKLLGGYATGTLTEEERTALFEAALHDPALFESLAEEQALKEVFDDPAARAQLVQATETPRFTLAGAVREWLGRPRSKVMVTVAAALVVAIGVRTLQDRTEPTPAMSGRTAVLEAPRESIQGELRQNPGKMVRQPRKTQLAVKKSSPARISEPGGAVAQPPPPPSEELVQVVSSGAAELRYVLLRKGTEVSSNTMFERDDIVQLRIEVNREGTLQVTASGAALYAGPAGPQAPVVVPAGAGRDGILRIAFRTLPENAVALRYQAEGAQRAKMSSAPSPVPQAAADTIAMLPAVTAEVTIRRKNR